MLRVLLLAVVLGGLAFSARVLVEVLAQSASLRPRWGAEWTVWVVWIGAGCVLGAALAVRLARGPRGSRQPAPGAGALRWAVVVGVLTAAWYVAFGQPYRTLTCSVHLALGYGVLALSLLVGPALLRRAPRRAVRAADVVLFNLCLVPVAAELALRACHLATGWVLLERASDSPAQRLAGQRLPPGTVHFGFPLDSRGHHDHEPPGRERDGPLVASVGDSFSLGVVPHGHHFTTVCESVLPGVEVYNAGIPGTGPPEYLHLLVTELLPLEPDLVVVNLFLGNDVRCPGQTEESLLARWFDRQNLLVHLLPRRLATIAAERERTGGRAGRRAGGRDADSMPWLEDPLLEKPTLSRLHFHKLEVTRLKDGFQPARSDYRGLLRSVAAILEAAGETPVAFLLIPDELQVEDALWEELLAGRRRADFDRDLPQRVVGRWLDERGVPHLDLLPRLRAVEPLADGWRHVYHRQDTHFNARGNRIAGLALAELVGPFVGR